MPGWLSRRLKSNSGPPNNLDLLANYSPAEADFIPYGLSTSMDNML